MPTLQGICRQLSVRGNTYKLSRQNLWTKITEVLPTNMVGKSLDTLQWTLNSSVFFQFSVICKRMKMKISYFIS